MAVSNHPGVSSGVSSAQPSQKTFCFSGRRPLYSPVSPPPPLPLRGWRFIGNDLQLSLLLRAAKQGCLPRLQAARRCQSGVWFFAFLGERSQTGRGGRSWRLVANPPASPERGGAARAHPRAPHQAADPPARPKGRKKEGKVANGRRRRLAWREDSGRARQAGACL